MALLTPASETLPTIKGFTRNEIMKLILRILGGEYGVATGGDTNYLDDTTKLKSSQYSSDEWVSAWLRISKDTSSLGSAIENVISSVTTYDPTTNGRLNLSPSYSIAIAAGDEYELHRDPHPRVITDIIDECLANLVPSPCWSLLSELPDFDMEQDNTTDWASSNATVTKTTTNPISGVRSLSVVTTAANGYARAQLMNVEPGKQYYVSAAFRCSAASTTAKLIAYDETNSAAIESKSAARLQNSRLWFQFTTPATCYQISIRMSNVENSVTTIWDDAVLYALDSRTISLPWWVKNPNQVKGVFGAINYAIATDLLDEESGELDPRWDVLESSFGAGKLKLRTRTGTMNKPLFIYGVRYHTAFANDNVDVKLLDENLFLNCVMYKIFEYMVRESRAGYLDSKQIQNFYLMYEDRWKKSLYSNDNRVEKVLKSAPTRGYFNGRLDSLGW